jgi:hypothetical protein
MGPGQEERDELLEAAVDDFLRSNPVLVPTRPRRGVWEWAMGEEQPPPSAPFPPALPPDWPPLEPPPTSFPGHLGPDWTPPSGGGLGDPRPLPGPVGGGGGDEDGPRSKLGWLLEGLGIDFGKWKPKIDLDIEWTWPPKVERVFVSVERRF